MLIFFYSVTFLDISAWKDGVHILLLRHIDVMPWTHFPHHWSFVWEIYRSSCVCWWHERAAVEQRVALPVVWDVMTLLWHHCNVYPRDHGCNNCASNNGSCRPKSQALNISCSVYHLTLPSWEATEAINIWMGWLFQNMLDINKYGICYSGACRFGHLLRNIWQTKLQVKPRISTDGLWLVHGCAGY